MRGSSRLPCFCFRLLGRFYFLRESAYVNIASGSKSPSYSGDAPRGTSMYLHPSGKFDNSARPYRHIEARPLAAAMGAEICGVSIGRETDAQFAEIEDALFRHKMIFFRNQRMGHAEQHA